MTFFCRISSANIHFTNEKDIMKVNKVKEVFPLQLYDWLLITFSFRDPPIKLFVAL